MTTRAIEELQAISENALQDLEMLRSLELEKRSVDPGSDRFRVLSDEIEVLAERLRVVSSAESTVADEIAGEPGLPTIEEADARS